MNNQSLGLLIRLLIACAYLLKVGMYVNEIFGFWKEKNHT
jgi:DNA primase large subunit